MILWLQIFRDTTLRTKTETTIVKSVNVLNLSDNKIFKKWKSDSGIRSHWLILGFHTPKIVYKSVQTNSIMLVISNCDWRLDANLIGMLLWTIFNCFSAFITIFLNYYRPFGIVLDYVGCKFSTSNTEPWILFCAWCKRLDTFQCLF